ncbi:mycofactocin-coupled SDR family oxidoreductase [Capillimicrobium parvum]|uniref:Oxidoreductase n=1 Tax=Capillimicrobium parvum TaxID=2884022 RepID=A0A9E6XWA1_9ACTN|nr:mycofactocin-coupled SDR family oxidoreductase [Capillimicrobium parvum]UGS35335.1 putative oxidoreductase [Capillimicrobium parvum]
MTGVAIVTGAARGIGAATVRRLAADGWQVIAVDLCADDPRLPYPLGTEAELERAVADADAAGPGAAIGRIADAGDAEAMARIVAEAQELHGGLDAFIASAGVIAGGVPLWEMAPDQERAVVETDLLAVMTGARVAIPALLSRPQPRSGRYLAVASTAATRGLPLLAAYCAAKAGVTGLVRALAAELRGTGVTANAVSPGSTATPILDESARLYQLESAEAFAAQQPLDRLIRPDEVAAVLCMLAGPDGAAVTGATVPVDGGLAL